MRNRYKCFPVDYVDQLRSEGKRKKAMAFMDFCMDKESGEYNSVRFYAEAWGVGKSTAARWIKEFRYEIDRFENYWNIKNNYNKPLRNNKNNLYDKQVESNRQERSAQKSVGQMGHLQGDKWDSEEPPKNGDFKKQGGTKSKNERDKDNNIYNNNYLSNKQTAHLLDARFQEILTAYRVYSGKAYKSEETYKAFIKAIEDVKEYRLLITAIKRYFDDMDVKRRVWLKRFLEEGFYQSYLKPLYRISVDDKEIIGTYNKDTEKLISKDEELVVKIPLNVFDKEIAKNKIQIVGYAA